MATHIILAQSSTTAAALAGYLSLTQLGYGLAASDTASLAKRLVWADDVTDVKAYRIIADQLELLAMRADGIVPANEIVVLVDHVDLRRLDPLAPNGWESVIASLILTFPEFYWIFAAVRREPERDASRTWSRHSWTALGTVVVDPLFDATGLRDVVRATAAERLAGSDSQAAAYLPRRTEAAVAIDDEPSYAYVNAYAAYRFGFRGWPITDEALLDRALERDGYLHNFAGFRLSIEDIALNFPDRAHKHRDTHWSNLAERSRKLPALDGEELLRTFVTSGATSRSTSHVHRANRSVRDTLKRSGRLGTVVQKPIAGIFDVWKATGLMRVLSSGKRRGFAAGFFWPPDRIAVDALPAHGHSAPGRLLEVATRLTRRAARMLTNGHTAATSIQGAVLATDAMELLGGKAPTTALEALALKHTFEAISECQFYGVQTHFDVASRLNEIRAEVRDLCRGLAQHRRREVAWNAEAAVLNNLTRVYRTYNQFDEELLIQTRQRVLHRRLWFKSRFSALGDELRWLNPAYWIACYVHFLLRSLPVFLLTIMLWVTGLGVLYANTSTRGTSLHRGFEDAISSFFSVGAPIHHGREADAGRTQSSSGAVPSPPQPEAPCVSGVTNEADRNSAWYVAVTCLAIVSGFLHGGVFISHVYSLMMRR